MKIFDYWQSQDFHRPVDGNELKHYADYVHHPMDLSSIEKVSS